MTMAKKSPLPASPDKKALLYPGRVARVNNFWVDANQSRELAQRLVPLLGRYILVMFAVSALAMVVSVVSLWSRPDPLVLLSYPDGTNRCAPPAINPATHQPQPRPAAYVDTCASLAASNLGEVNP